MSPIVVNGGSPVLSRSRLPVWPMVALCVGALLPWGQAGRSGVVGEGKYALLLGVIGLALYALAATQRLDVRWWRLASVPLALGCLALSAEALNSYGALGAIVTGVSAVAWLVVSSRAA